MGVVTIQCPRTGMRASTGLEMDEATFEALPEVKSTMHCWLCGAEHVWSRRWAKLESFVEERDRSAARVLSDVNLQGRE